MVIYCGIFITLPPGVHNTSFSSELMKEPIKIQCYIILVWKDFPWTNTLVYLAPFLNYEETVVFHMVSVHSTSFSSELTNGPNKIGCYITLG